MAIRILGSLLFLLMLGCAQPENNYNTSYFTNTDTGVQTGGVKVIEIQTPIGPFKVWTKEWAIIPASNCFCCMVGRPVHTNILNVWTAFYHKKGLNIFTTISLGHFIQISRKTAVYGQPSDL